MGIILFDEVQDLLDNGTPADEIFEWVDDPFENIRRVRLNDKYNFINSKNKLISTKWYDDAGRFGGHVNEKVYTGVATVYNDDHKINLINAKGELMCSQWFDDIYYFFNNFAVVLLDDKYNYINIKGKLVSDQWFDYVDRANGDTLIKKYMVAYVRMEEPYHTENLLDLKTGKLLLDEKIIDNIDDLANLDGIVTINANNKVNYFDLKTHKFISN